MDTFTCHGESLDVQGRNPGKLAVIAPMLERIKLKDTINQHIPTDQQAEFDYGSILSLMLAARLDSPVAMSNNAEWAEKSGADIYFGIPWEKLNDDRETLTWTQATFLSIEQHRRRDKSSSLPKEQYSLSELSNSIADPEAKTAARTGWLNLRINSKHRISKKPRSAQGCGI